MEILDSIVLNLLHFLANLSVLNNLTVKIAKQVIDIMPARKNNAQVLNYPTTQISDEIFLKLFKKDSTLLVLWIMGDNK